MIEILLAGLALMLIFEGIMPFVAPRVWKESFRRIVELSDAHLQLAGLASMLAGLVLLYFVV